jgi:periplasmic divalent cation tolerance protein
MYTLRADLTSLLARFNVRLVGELEPISAVVTSVGTEQQAVEISEDLVARGLATCINIVPCYRSIYRWKGKVCTDTEHLLIIKTRSSLFGAVTAAIRELHSYELPEILEFPLAHAEPNFHRWVVEMATGVPDPDLDPESDPAFD